MGPLNFQRADCKVEAMMRVSESGLERIRLSKYMDDYVDGDGWKSNAADKVIINQAIAEFYQASDSIEKKISALEMIRSFEQDGGKASEWLKTSVQQSEYTPALMEVLRKLVGIWNRKLRGVKTYVFVSEIINYMIHELYQVPASTAVLKTMQTPSESAKPLTLVVSVDTKNTPTMTLTPNSGSSLKFVAPSQKVTLDSKQKEFEQENKLYETMLNNFNREKSEHEKLLKQLETRDQELARIQKSYADELHLKEDKIKTLEAKLRSIAKIIS